LPPGGFVKPLAKKAMLDMPILAAVFALLAPADEHLALPMQPGFETAHQQQAQTGSIEERVPRGETVEDWSRMVTLLQLYTDMPPETYLANFTANVGSACPGTKTVPATKTMVAGHKMLEGRLDCPRNPATGKPETFVYRLYQGNGRLHMAQIAFRKVPSATEIGWARSELAQLIFCEAGSTVPACAGN
jgi:hypothetical protein